MDTFRRHLQLSALGNLHDLLRLVARLSLGVLDLLYYIKALENLAKYNVLAVQPPVSLLVPIHIIDLLPGSKRRFLPGDNGGNEELGAIGILARVRHGQKTGLRVLKLEVLIGELLAVD